MSVTHQRARVASLTRSRTPDDPELLDARRELVTEQLEVHIARQVAKAPPLTAEQKARLASIVFRDDPPAAPAPTIRPHTDGRDQGTRVPSVGRGSGAA